MSEAVLEHAQVSGAERLDRHACGRDGVVDEVDLTADLMAREQIVILAEPGRGLTQTTERSAI